MQESLRRHAGSADRVLRCCCKPVVRHANTSGQSIAGNRKHRQQRPNLLWQVSQAGTACQRYNGTLAIIFQKS